MDMLESFENEESVDKGNVLSMDAHQGKPQWAHIDNSLVRSFFDLTLDELRLLFLGIRRIRFQDVNGPDSRYCVMVPVSAWAEELGIVNGRLYETLRFAAAGLMRQHVILRGAGDRERRIQWLYASEYLPRSGNVYLEFGGEVLTFLMRFQGYYTRVDVRVFGQLRSFYGARLYIMLRQFHETGVCKISVKDYRYAMGCEKKFSLFGHLKESVITAAVEDINRVTDLHVAVEYVKEKRGRKIEGLVFKFRRSVHEV